MYLGDGFLPQECAHNILQVKMSSPRSSSSVYSALESSTMAVAMGTSQHPRHVVGLDLQPHPGLVHSNSELGKAASDFGGALVRPVVRLSGDNGSRRLGLR